MMGVVGNVGLRILERPVFNLVCPLIGRRVLIRYLVPGGRAAVVVSGATLVVVIRGLFGRLARKLFVRLGVSVVSSLKYLNRKTK